MDLLTQMKRATEKLFLKPKDDAASKETDLHKKDILLDSKVLCSPDDFTQEEKIEALHHMAENAYHGATDSAKLAGTFVPQMMSMWTKDAPMPLQLQIAKSLSLIVPPNTDVFEGNGHINQVIDILITTDEILLVRWILYFLACSFANSVRLMKEAMKIRLFELNMKSVVRRADEYHAQTTWNENYGHLTLKLLGYMPIN